MFIPRKSNSHSHLLRVMLVKGTRHSALPIQNKYSHGTVPFPYGHNDIHYIALLNAQQYALFNSIV